MLSVVTDGKDGRGFTIEKVVQMFFSFNAMAVKITKQNGQCSLVRFAWYLLHNPRLQEHFVYG